jgi:hypothetical protein
MFSRETSCSSIKWDYELRGGQPVEAVVDRESP